MNKKEITNWAKTYLKNRDIINNEILEINDDYEGFDFVAKKITENLLVITEPDLAVAKEKIEKFEKSSELSNISIFCLNTRKNLDCLINNWEFFSKFKKLAILFINPNSAKEKKWMLYPFTHNFISDKKTLVQGLKSIAENVDFIE